MTKQRPRKDPGRLVRKAAALAAPIPLAVLLLSAACSKDPLPELLSQAQTAHRMGDLRTAAVYYGTAATEAPDNDFIRWQLAKLLLTLRDGAAAEKQIRAAAALGVGDDRIRPALAQALFLQGRHQDVVDLPIDGLGKTPAAVVLAYQCRALIELGTIATANERLEEAVRLSRYTAEVAFAEAELALVGQDTEAAVSALTNTRMFDPEFPYAAARLGEIALVQGDAEKAEWYLSEAVERHHGSWRDLLNRGVARLRQGKVDEARDDARRLLAAEPARSEVRLFAQQAAAGQADAGQLQGAVEWLPQRGDTAQPSTSATRSPPMNGPASAAAGEAGAHTGTALSPSGVAATATGLLAETTGADATVPLSPTPAGPAFSLADRETGLPTGTGAPQAEAVATAPTTSTTTAGQGRDGPTEATAAVAATVQAWADAWSRQDVDDYLAHYASDFRPADGTGRAAWAEQRRERLTRPRSVRIELSQLEITLLAPDRAQASFLQDYRASHYRDRVDKTLGLGLEDGAWKILRETSR